MALVLLRLRCGSCERHHQTTPQAHLRRRFCPFCGSRELEQLDVPSDQELEDAERDRHEHDLDSGFYRRAA